MITLTTSDLIIARLAMDPQTWEQLTHWNRLERSNRFYDLFVNHQYLGLTVEKFERDAPLCDLSAYGVESQFGPLIGIYTFENPIARHHALNYKLGFNNGKMSLRIMGFDTHEQREQFLKPDYPFRVSEMFF